MESPHRPQLKRLNRPIGDSVMAELRKITRAIEMRSKSLEKKAGITTPQLVVLREVADRGDFSVGQIARDVSLSQGTETGILERMERRGLVLRQQSPLDRRRVLVRITESGKVLLEKALPMMQATFNDRFGRLPGWKQTMILSSLQQLVTIMQTESGKR